MIGAQNPAVSDLFSLFAANEPESLRTYLAVPQAGQQLVLGSSVPSLQSSFARDRVGLWVPESASGPQPLDMFLTYVTLPEYAVPSEFADTLDLDALVDELSAWGPFQQRIVNVAMLTGIADDEDKLDTLAELYRGMLQPAVAERLHNTLRTQPQSPRRRLLSRQGLFVAMKEILRNPDDDPRTTDGSIARSIALVHTVSSRLSYRSANVSESLLGGMPSTLVMELVQNELFHRSDDDLSLLYRHYLLWTRYGGDLVRTDLRRTPDELLAEATGLGILDWIAFGFAVVAQRRNRTSDSPFWFSADYFSNADPDALGAFLQHTAADAETFSREFDGVDERWGFLPIQQHPILEHADSYLLLDESSLLDRVTRSLYWDVHDHERDTHGDQALLRWTQAHGEMIESYAVDTAKTMAPPLLGPGQTVYLESEFRAVYDGKICDVGIDLGRDMCLIEVVGGQVKTGTRIDGDPDDFAADTERLVLKKARQLSSIAAEVLLDESKLTGVEAVANRRLVPVLVGLGTYPVNPLSIGMIEQLLEGEGLFDDPRIEPLCIIDLGELEMLSGWSSGGGPTIAEALLAWKQSDMARISLRNWAHTQAEIKSLNWRSPILMDGSSDLFELVIDRLGLRDGTSGENGSLS